jgi:hypothetical protein
VREVPDAFTNEAPARIRKIEDAARRQDAQADLWIPLKKAVVESPALTNEQQRAWLAQTIETARDGMREAADRLRDLDGVAAERVAHGEPAVYTMWQMVVQPPGLIEENLALQSNALVRAGHPLAAWRPDQPEAGRLTGLFRERFPAWADQVVAQARTDTNAPSLSPENRAEIERLAEETQALQARAAKESADETRQPLQQRAVANLERIRELLPKQRQPQPQPQPQEQPPREQPQQQPQPQPQEKQEEQSKESPSEPQEQPRETPPPDVQELLRRALQREKEHAEEKRRQMQQIPLPPGERDW